MELALENIKDVNGVLVDGMWEVPVSLDLSGLGLTKLPPLRKVGGGFYCYSNHLTSLDGAPRKVGGSFYCSNNHLTSLEGAPQKVGGLFYCSYNQLTSLKGAPREVGRDFYCNSNQLTSLKGAPREVVGNFDCYSNRLTSLEGAPEKVNGAFYGGRNLLTSLEGAPREVGRGFYCSYNQLPSGETYQKWLARRAAPKTATVRNASAQGNFPSQDAFIAQVAAAKDKNEWTSAELSLALASFVYTNDLGGRLLKFLLAYTAEKDEDE